MKTRVATIFAATSALLAIAAPAFAGTAFMG